MTFGRRATVVFCIGAPVDTPQEDAHQVFPTRNLMFKLTCRTTLVMSLLVAGALTASTAMAQDDIAERIRRAAPVTPAEPIRSGPTAQPSSSPPTENRSRNQLNVVTPTPADTPPVGADGGECEVCGDEPNSLDFAEQAPPSSPPRAQMGANSSVQMRPMFPRISRIRDRFHARPRRLRKVLFGVCGIPSIAAKLDHKGGCWNHDFWAAAGTYGNTHGREGAGGNAPLRFNDLALEPALHQAWYSLQRQPDYFAKGLGWGLGFDIFWGADGPDAQVGSSPLQLTEDNEWDNTWDTSSRYGLAIPQFYFEAAWNRWAVRMGRFFSIFGYESVPAHQNFFYSHSYAFNYNQPLSHWGVMVRTQWGEKLVSYSGRTTGWETSLQNDDNDGGATFAGFDYTPIDWIKLHGALAWGDPGDLDTGETDFYLHEAYMQMELTDTIDYVIQHTFQTRTRPVGTTPVHAFKLYGLTNYLYWYLNEIVSLGARYEWMYAGEGTGTALSPNLITPGTHLHALTLGANVRVRPRIVLRPEIRYDWVDFDGAAPGPFDNGTENSQVTLGMQSVFIW